MGSWDEITATERKVLRRGQGACHHDLPAFTHRTGVDIIFLLS